LSDEHPEHVKIVVDLPDAEDGITGEGLWAKPLGEDLYEVDNSPWHSRDINYRDVVKAIAPAADKKPVVVSIERRSGHRTIQVVLLKSGQARMDEILTRLKELGATYERAHSVLIALDFAPDVSWEPAMEYLDKLTDEGLLECRWSSWGDPSDIKPG
jgi:hypothetical protein